MSYTEYKTDAQVNYGFFNTFDTDGKYPIEAKSIWSTLADLQEYAEDDNNNAYAGKVVVVLEDNDNNGVYLIKSIGAGAEVEKLGANVTLSVDTIAEAYALATDDNIGQIIYVKEESSFEGQSELYAPGPYVVTSFDEMSLLSTTSGTGVDVETQIQGIKADVATLESDVDEVESSVTDLEGDITRIDSSISSINNSISSLTTTTTGLQDQIDGLDLGEDNVIESIAVNNVAAVITNKSAEITIGSADIFVGGGGEYAESTIVGAITDLGERMNSAETSLSNTPEYTLSSITANDGMVSSYQLKKDGVGVGDVINIPKDQVLDSAEIKTVDTADSPYTGAVVGDKYIEFLFQNSNPQYLPVQDLVDVYTGSGYITIDSSNDISLDYSSLKTQLTADLDVVKTVNTNRVAGIELNYSGNELALSVNIPEFKAAAATNYTAGDGLSLNDSNEFSVDVASIAASLASDTTEGGIGEKLTDLSTEVDAKADQSVVSTLSDTVDALDTAVAAKADQSAVDTISSSVDTLSDTVDTLSQVMSWGVIG